jgi:hypothetical protein
VPRRHTHRALALLLIFGIGGLGTPLAHQLDHLIELWSHEAPADVVATAPDSSKTVHGCELCEVRLAAIELDVPERTADGSLALPEVPAPQVVPTQLLRAFDGRAPPALA